MVVQYPCPICGKIFKQQAHLDRHSQNKTPCSLAKDHPYSCRCGKAFTQASNLSRHKKVCNGPQITEAMIIQDLTRQLSALQAELAALKEERNKVSESASEPEIDRDDTVIRSCGIGTALDVFKPAVYFGSPGPLLIPEVDIVGQLIKFGESLNVPDRISKCHIPDYGGFQFLDCVPSINPRVIEQKLKQMLDMRQKRVKCKTENKKYRDTEVFVVRDQKEYQEIVLLCKSMAESHENEVLGLRKKDLDEKVIEKEQLMTDLISQLQRLQSTNDL